MTPNTCPDRDTLEKLLLGKLPSGLRPELEQHLLSCDLCSSAAGQLAANDEIIKALRDDSLVIDDSDGILDELIQRGKKLSLEIDTVRPSQTITVGVPDHDSPAFKKTGKSDNALEPKDILGPPEAQDEIGRLGGYRILELLGEGGMGLVFRAEDPKLQRNVALKAMKPCVASNESAKERFLKEARAAASIEHDNIVEIYQVGEDHNVPFIAMRSLAGESLQTRLQRQKRLTQIEAARIGREISAGLAAAHEQGLIHRDIKPDNIWLEAKENRVKILDFGLVSSAQEDAGLTKYGVVMGTPRYMAPEQAQGFKVDPRCDLFSLGCVLYQLVSGQTPFGGDNVTATLIAVAQDEPTLIDSLCPKLDPEFAQLIMQLLSKDRNKRPATAFEVIEVLKRIETRIGAESSQQDCEVNSDRSTDNTLTQECPKFGRVSSTQASFPRNRLLMGAGLLVLPLVTFVGLWNAGVILQFESKKGTLVVEIDDFEKPIELVVGKDDSLTLIDPHDGREISITIDEENNQLRLAKQGFSIVTKEFSLESNEGRKIKVSFLPQPHSEATPNEDQESLTSAYEWPSDQPTPAIIPFTATEAGAFQQTWADYANVDDKLTNSVGMDLRVIPAGEFSMGIAPDELEELKLEVEQLKIPVDKVEWYIGNIGTQLNRHTVTLSKPYAMSATEVTIGQFRRFVEETGYVAKAEENGLGGGGERAGNPVSGPEFIWNYAHTFDTAQTDDHPVVNVSWLDAVAFCEWLSEKEGETYRLPTEAEWEFACRAGSSGRYCFGDDHNQLQDFAWLETNSGGMTRPVSHKSANAFGLYDMHGNVREWCLDVYDGYPKTSVINPLHRSDHNGRRIRGGSYRSHAIQHGSGFRYSSTLNVSQSTLGFRVVKVLQPDK